MGVLRDLADHGRAVGVGHGITRLDAVLGRDQPLEGVILGRWHDDGGHVATSVNTSYVAAVEPSCLVTTPHPSRPRRTHRRAG